jgi:hypothetical protein
VESFEVLSTGTENKHLSQNSRFPGRNSTQASPDQACESNALPLDPAYSVAIIMLTHLSLF